MRHVLSVTITPEAAEALDEALARAKEAGWGANKSQIVSNAILHFCNNSLPVTMPPIARGKGVAAPTKETNE